MGELEIIPITFRKAKQFIAENHRHSKPPQGHKFSIGLQLENELVGVVMVGRPVARRLDNGLTAEVLRCCTLGHPNACSMLYGAAWRAAKAMGYKKCVTYILDTEKGVSLKASNWKIDGLVTGDHKAWGKRNPKFEGYTEKRLVSKGQYQDKQRWVIQ